MSLHFILQGCSLLAHTHLHTRCTHSLIFQGLVLFGQRCANRRCNTSPDSSQKQGGETCWPNKQPTLSHRERRDFSGFTETHTQTHLHAVCVCVCNSSFYMRVGPLATFLNVCLSSLKTGTAAGLNSSQQAVHRAPIVLCHILLSHQKAGNPIPSL